MENVNVGAQEVSARFHRCYGYDALRPGDLFVLEVGCVVRITPTSDGWALLHHTTAYGGRDSFRHNPPKHGRLVEQDGRLFCRIDASTAGTCCVYRWQGSSVSHKPLKGALIETQTN